MEQKDLKVHLTRQCSAEFDFILEVTRGVEVSGLGRVVRNTMGVLGVTELFIMKNVSTSITTFLSPETIAELIVNIPNPEQVKLWWHSHHQMAAFWSGTDEQACKLLTEHSGWYLSIVLSTATKNLARIDYDAGFGHMTIPLQLESYSILTDKRKKEIIDILGI